MASQHPISESTHHRRVKSSVLPNFSFMHKRAPSDGTTLPVAAAAATPLSPRAAGEHQGYFEAASSSVLPLGHPHYYAPLGEVHGNNQQYAAPPPLSPRKQSKEGKRPGGTEDGFRSLHKKTLSSISLKALSKKDGEKVSKAKEPKASKPKSSKSSTNLASLLSRPKSSKSLRKEAQEQEAQEQKDKENIKPKSSETSRPPIYSQFSSEYFTKQPLGGKFLEDEIDLYTPKDYSPGKQRNFYAGPGSQPTLARREAQPLRPSSTYLPSSFSVQDISRRVSGEVRRSADLVRRVSLKMPSLERKSSEATTSSERDVSIKTEKTTGTRSQRVFAAVSNSFAKTAKPAETEGAKVLDDKDIEREFEAMLDRRNILEHQRGKMRSLALSMKRDFIKQDWAETEASRNSRPGTRSSDSSADAAVAVSATEGDETKTKRPRSRTFTLSRGNSKEPSSPTKKSKPERTMGKHSRNKSAESVTGGGSGGSGTRSLTASGAAVAQTLIAKAKGQCPDDFVSYLRKVPRPEAVEVGRLHKLRLLLRNETVAWTDEFIAQGGMEEIVGLLHRILEVEWREEHEDALLHEVLLCLKALVTTALALQHLNDIQTRLFPALLHMIFDEEKKGPSEFTTRNIVTSLLFTYLKSAPLNERTHRAQILLSYLRDPEASESRRPVEFVLHMRTPRPYQVWTKEVVNVTKEVFWIFLHNLNVIALPGTRGAAAAADEESPDPHDGTASTDPAQAYASAHFPRERPPVPAAPYVGGVEWDATNYLASHLDLVNGIVASLPTAAERNTLRAQMRVSGWERCMGGTLRLCKEKFYGGVHAGLRCWVRAAVADGWDTRDVRCGPEVGARSPRNGAGVKKAAGSGEGAEAPRIEMRLDFLGGDEVGAGAAANKGGVGASAGVDDGWL